MSGCESQSTSATRSTSEAAAGHAPLTVSCPAISQNSECPREFTSTGAGSSPEIHWSGAPPETKSFAISLWRRYDDPSADAAWTSSYWLIYNIPADITSLPKDVQDIGVEGYNDSGKKGYYSLRSKKVGVGQYHLTVYALSDELAFSSDMQTRRDFLNAAKGMILAEGTLDFHYDNSKAKLTQK
ncbi:YbhB/YbcL family Raf kinase inhibitor-like protein [Schlesneria paludicola]|uniref:YbhB/YbcL family Raf kinase inhibitor-like protein n=1 Tax=Schlesneria paludicola TaxID=360056 RepID=UPI0002E16777|nr:YbhB/YbcL family Raf kinase inhibitor-like protein [Schlesneria paludicola]